MQSLRRLLKSILLLFCILRTTAQRTPLSIERQLFNTNGDYGRDQLWALFRHFPHQQQQQQQQQKLYHHHHQDQLQQQQQQHHRYDDTARTTGNGNVEIVLASSLSSPSPSSSLTNDDDTMRRTHQSPRYNMNRAKNILSFPLGRENEGSGESDFTIDDATTPTTASINFDADDNVDVWNNVRGGSWGRNTEWPLDGAPLTEGQLQELYQFAGKSKSPLLWPWSWPMMLSARKRNAGGMQTTGELLPPISSDALKRLSVYFQHLKNNVDYAHNHKLTQDQLRLLDGDHPLHMLQVNSPDMNPEDVSAFLKALRTYQPSQKVRTLVALTPNGYQGSHLIDPNYMWIGLGR